MAAAIICDTVATGATLGALACLATIVARAFIAGDDLRSTAPLLVLGAGCFLVRAAATTGADLLAARASARLRTTVRHDVLRRLAARSRVAQGHTAAETATVLTDRVEALDGYTTQYARAAAMCVIGPTLVFVVIGFIDPICLLVLAFTGPMLVLLLAVIGAKTRRLTEAREAELGWLHGFFLDLVTGLGTLRSYGRAADGATAIAHVSRRHGRSAMEVLRTAFQTSLVMEWAATAATALVAVIVSFRLVGDRLAFAVALTALVLTPEFFLPFRRLAAAYHAGADGKAAWLSITALRGADTGPVAADDPVLDLTTGIGPIRFDAVTARYPDVTHAAMAPASFHIEPGETVALTGPTGCGKTTVTRLLLGLMPVAGGTLTVGGRRVADLDLPAWHRSIAWVSQHPVIVAGTVADNVRLGRPDATDAEVHAALATAAAGPFVATLPAGLDTVLDEGGRTLSAGQRQRLAIARALLRDAPLLVLDECTAHLDAETETAVLDALRPHLAQRTVLLISHRPAAVALADRVVALEPTVVPA